MYCQTVNILCTLLVQVQQLYVFLALVCQPAATSWLCLNAQTSFLVFSHVVFSVYHSFLYYFLVFLMAACFLFPVYSFDNLLFFDTMFAFRLCRATLGSQCTIIAQSMPLCTCSICLAIFAPIILMTLGAVTVLLMQLMLFMNLKNSSSCLDFRDHLKKIVSLLL